MTKTVILGAGGIVGQNMVRFQPDGVEAVFTRRTDGPVPYIGLDVRDLAVTPFLDHHAPDVIVNLVGENRVDVVERNPGDCLYENVTLPHMLAMWTAAHGARLVQVSTQAVFDGEEPPYGPESLCRPITEYGKQKYAAEELVATADPAALIARLTFVLGVRLFPGLGRENPLEAMFAQSHQVQVDDRWFSPLLAEDAARLLWELALNTETGIVHLGEPIRVCRSNVAWQSIHMTFRSGQIEMTPVSHEAFPGIAPRPRDTTWAPGARFQTPLQESGAMVDRFVEWSQMTKRSIERRALEISMFLRLDQEPVRSRLAEGFHANHAEVAADFNAAQVNVDDPDQLLHWYRTTTAYIFELSAYHLDDGFNYGGMCDGIVAHLKAAGALKVIALGDGIGDLTGALLSGNLDATYHDLAGSRTAEYALAQLGWNHGHNVKSLLTDGWSPPRFTDQDAVVALDFFEHLVNVEEWAQAVFDGLASGGLFMAQNAFSIGDNEHGGSIPMHLSINNRYETEWPELLERIGFVNMNNGWWQKP